MRDLEYLVAVYNIMCLNLHPYTCPNYIVDAQYTVQLGSMP